MIEIPIISLELYQQPERFGQELGEALKTNQIVQVDGLNQKLVDELYQSSEEVFDKYPKNNHSFPGHSNTNLEEDNQKHHNEFLMLSTYEGLSFNPKFMTLAKKVGNNFKEIYGKVRYGLSLYSGDISFRPVPWEERLMLLKYSPDENEKIVSGDLILKEAHYDARRVTITPKSTQPGLEGFVNEEWVPIQPEEEHVLVFEETLKHRVRITLPFKEPRKTLVYGSR